MNKIAASILLLMLSVPAYPQAVVGGRVTDADDGAGMANVIVKILVPDAEPARIIRFATTGGDGGYSIKFDTDLDEVDIEFSFLGYETVKSRIKAVSQTVNQTMHFKSVELKEVTVKAPPIASHGDTVNYHVGSFITPFDNKIEDIIKKLPGITVTEKGRIEYQGKPINKFYIEGLDMLEGKYNLATQNIPADQVATVQIFENHQPVKMLKDISFSERAALNLKLKNNRMARPVGTVTAGMGYSDKWLYRGELFGFMTNRRQQVLYTLKADNSGYHTFENELTAHYGAEEKSIKAKDIVDGILFSVPGRIRDRSGDISALAASANTIRQLGENTSLKANVAYRKDEKKFEQEIHDRYYLDGGEFLIDEFGKSAYTNNEISGSVSFEKNEDAFYINNLFDGKLDFGDSRADVVSVIENKQNFDMKSVGLRNKLNLMWKRGTNTYGINSLVYGGNVPGNRLTICTSSRQGAVTQQVEGYSIFSEHSTRFSKLVGTTSTFTIRLAVNTEYDRINTCLGKVDTVAVNKNHGYELLTTAILGYQYRKNRFRLMLSVPLKLYDISFNDDAAFRKYRDDIPQIDANVSLSYKLSYYLSVTLGGNRTHSVGDIMDFLQGEIQKSYKTSSIVKSGILEQNRTTGFNGGYNYRHTLNGVFSSFIFNYAIIRGNILRGSEVLGDGRMFSFSDVVGNDSKNAMGQFYFAKNFHKAGTVVSFVSRYSHISGKQLRSGRILPYANNIVSFIPAVSFNYFEWSSLRISGQTDWAEMSVGDCVQKIDNEMFAYNINGELSFLPQKNLECFYRLIYTDNPKQGIKRERLYWMDCGVRFHLNNKIQFELEAYNLTGIKSYSRRTYSFIDERETLYKLRPFTVVFQVKFGY